MPIIRLTITVDRYKLGPLDGKNSQNRAFVEGERVVDQLYKTSARSLSAVPEQSNRRGLVYSARLSRLYYHH